MILSFLICYFSYPDHRAIYKGNYTTALKKDNSFLFHFYSNKTLCPLCSYLIFQPNNTRYFQFTAVDLYGISSSNYSSFFYFGYVSKNKNQKTIIDTINQAMANLKLTEPYDHDRIQREVYRLYPKKYPPIYSLAFNVSVIKKPVSAFYSHTEAIGKIYVNNNTQFPFKVVQFDELLFISEGKIFGLLSSFSIFISFIAWRYLQGKFTSMVHLSQLSVHSFIMQVSFDFNFGVLLFNFSDSNNHLKSLFSLLFAFILILYFFYETRQLSDIWRASLGDLENIDVGYVYFTFFLEIMIVVSLYSSSMSLVFDMPLLCMPVMFSYLVPQIVHTAQTIGRKSNDTLFNVLLAVARLIPVFYFTCHRPNLKGTYSPLAAVLTTIYVFLQILVVLLQNSLGGSFFMPRSMRPVPFDYASGIVQPGTECPICLAPIEDCDRTMVTPCNHAFHKECLSRWMEEQLVCPVCRGALPPIEV